METDRLLVEAALVEGTADRAKREVVIDLIKAGFGNRRDNHYYGREILESHFQDFQGAKMYVDHLDPEAVKRLNGMPRSVRDLGGRITETWMDQDAAGNPVVRGRAKIAQPWLWELIENDPELLGVSINAWGKSKPGTVEGRQARIVEGIAKVGSVDWVTEAGAGGKVVSLVEAQLNEEEDSNMGLSDLSVERLKEERPDLISELLDDLLAEAEDYEQDEEAEGEEPEASETSPSDAPQADADEDDDDDADSGLTESEINSLVEVRALEIARERLDAAVEAAIEVVRGKYEEALEEQSAEFERQLAIRDQRIISARMIEEAGFKKPTEQALKEEFFDSYFEAEYDEDGLEVKSAEDVLTDAVSSAIARKREELSAYTEARVTGAGESGSGARLTEGQAVRPKSSPTDQDLNRRLGITE